MADNVDINAATATAKEGVAADEVTDAILGTKKVQYVKLMDGTLDGTAKAAVGVNGLKVDGSSVTQPVSIATNQPSGNVASGAADSGNPLKIGGRYNSTPPTLSDGNRADIQLDANGNLKVSLGTNIEGEDSTNHVMKSEHQYTPSGVLTGDTQVKASAGFIHTVTISCNDAAPTAGSIIIYNNTAESGTQVFNHTFTTTPFAPFTITLDMVMSLGIYVGFTTTADVNVSVSYR